MRHLLAFLVIFVGCFISSGCVDTVAPPKPAYPPAESHYHHHGHYAPPHHETEGTREIHAPEKVANVLAHIDREGRAPEGYEGGRTFHNAEGMLPKRNNRGSTIVYQEWDVNPHEQGKNRGAERLITGSDGSAYFTADHYRSFQKIR